MKTEKCFQQNETDYLNKILVQSRSYKYINQFTLNCFHKIGFLDHHCSEIIMACNHERARYYSEVLNAISNSIQHGLAFSNYGAPSLPGCSRMNTMVYFTLRATDCLTITQLPLCNTEPMVRLLFRLLTTTMMFRVSDTEHHCLLTRYTHTCKKCCELFAIKKLTEK